MRHSKAPFGACVLFLLLATAPARADEALHLNWDACGPAGPMIHASACGDNAGESRLYCAFSLAQPLDQVVGIEAVVDVQHADVDLPPWWQMGVGGCRYGALTASGGAPDGTDCVNFWQGQATGGIQGFAVGQPFGSPNQARIKVALSLLPADARSLDATTLYYAARLLVSNQSTTGAGSCAGCELPACLVLNSIWIKRLPGAPGGDAFLKLAAPGNGNMAMWQGAGADCQAVPVRKSTWGRLKSLYR